MSQFPIQTTREIPLVDSIRDTWPTFKDSLGVALGVPALLSYGPLILVGVPAGIVTVILALVCGSNKTMYGILMVPVVILFCVLFAIAYNIIRCPWVKMTLSIAQGQGASFGDLKTAMPWFKSFLLTNVAIGLATFIGSLCFVVPGIMIAVRCAFAPILVIDEDLSPIEAIKRSNELVTGQSWQIFFYFCAMSLANLVGGMIPIVSMFAPIAVMGYFDMALARIYYLRK